MKFSKILSQVSIPSIHGLKSTFPSGIEAAIFFFIQSSKVVNFKMAPSAYYVSKLASSNPSPASAKVSLVESTPNFSILCLRVIKLPVDLDIFSPSNMVYPLQNIDLGIIAPSYHIAE